MTYVDVPIETNPDADLAAFKALLQGHFGPDYELAEAELTYWIALWWSQTKVDLANLVRIVGAEAFRAFGQKVLGIPAIAARAAVTTVTITMTDTAGHNLPVGTQLELVSGDDVYGFLTTSALIVPNGETSGSVEVTAALEGSDVNGVTGLGDIIDGYAFVSSVVFDSPPADGVDEEDPADYLDRLTESTKLLTERPVKADEVAVFVKRVSGIERATAIDNYYPGVNEIQRISVTGTPTSGGSTLTRDGQTTASVAYNSTAANLKTKLEALPNIDVGDIKVTGGPLPGTPIDVEFTGTLAHTNVSTLTVTDSITGGDMTVTTTRAGVADDDEVEKSVTFYAVNELGLGVSDEIKAEALADLAEVSELNFLYYAEDPTYTTVDVEYQIVPRAGYELTAVTSVNAALGSYLSPAPWGRDANGRWVNRTKVFINELVALIDNQPSVETVVLGSVKVAKSGGARTAADLTLVGPAPLPLPGSFSGSVA